ncbi:MAG: sulfatase family protein [Planctomycetota bacterium]|jgi:arylsulfatase A-like enzyme
MSKPNILFIMSDDHAAHAISAYDSRINKTPNIDRIAENGVKFDNCFCTNSICEPSRAVILTGVHSHISGVTTLGSGLDNRLENVAKILQRNNYQTSIVGKWHLGNEKPHWPTGFDYWNVLQGQGPYFDPEMNCNGEMVQYEGYTTDLITEKTIEVLENRDKDKPFFMMCHHKAPHRWWEPHPDKMSMYEDEDILEPETFNDDYATRGEHLKHVKMKMEDLNERDIKGPVPEGLNKAEEKSYRYQRYIKDYLRTISSVDDSVGSLLDYLEENGLSDNTIVIYTSDQGFFLGDHGLFDKRLMYEESLRMPFLMQYPAGINGGKVEKRMINNLDFAPTWLDYAGIEIPEDFQGISFRPLFNEENQPKEWQDELYYRYWMNGDRSHNTTAHYGIRTLKYKLIYYYADPLGQTNAYEIEGVPREWELFDLEKDPYELNNVYSNPEYKDIVKDLRHRLRALQEKYKDEPYHLEDELPV